MAKSSKQSEGEVEVEGGNEEKRPPAYSQSEKSMPPAYSHYNQTLNNKVINLPKI